MDIDFARDVVNTEVADEWMMGDEHFTFLKRNFSAYKTHIYNISKQWTAPSNSRR